MAFSANAILTKTRAMHGRGLTEQNYSELMNCSDISDVASYLAYQTHYSDVLSDINASAIKRSILENALRKHLIRQFESISRFERAIGQELHKYFTIKNEIDEIISCIRYLKTPNADEYLMRMPAFLNSMTTIDLFALAKAQSFGEVVDSLKNSDYAKILEPFAAYDNTFDIIGVEAALFRYLYEQTEKSAEESLKGKELKEFLFAVRMVSDTKTISNLYRLKFIFKTESSKIPDYPIFFKGTNLEKKRTSELINAESEEDFAQVLLKTPYAAIAKDESDVSIDYKIERYKYSVAYNKLIFSVHPSVVMFCGKILAEYELMNIIRIAEGKKYNMPKEEIAKFLIGCDKLKND